MTGIERTDNHLSELMHDLAGSADEPIDEVLRRTAAMRQRPAWTFPERWLPMGVTTARMFPQVGRPLSAATLALLLLAALVVAYIGFTQRPTVPLPARINIDTVAVQQLDVADATYPAIGLGRLWATIGGAGVAQLDPVTGQQVRLTQIPASACGYLEIAFDRVWTPTCQTGGLAGVDLNGEVTMIPLGATISDELATIGVDDRALWIAAGGLGDQLVKVDPSSGSVVAQFAVPAGSTSPEPGFGSIWLANKDAGQAVRVDPVSGAVQATIAVGRLPRFVAVGAGAVWVVNQLDGTVSRIDPASNTVTITIEVGLLSHVGDIKVAGSSVWVRTEDGVARIDPAEGRVVETYGPLAGWGSLATDGSTSLWVTAPDAGKVWRLATD
jgi:virginiamycin B lyase